MRRDLIIGLAVLALTVACERRQPSVRSGDGRPAAGRSPGPAPSERRSGDDHDDRRARMVADQIEARGVSDDRVLAAMRTVPRHAFVPAVLEARAYDDRPLPIGDDQTISQPYIVAVMTELARVGPGARVLEIGTGSGYQAAVLAELGAEVYSIEIVEPLGRRAAETLARTGYGRVHLRIGDGYVGWPEAAPFDAVVVTAAPPRVPEPLRQQLRVGGRLVIPVGDHSQELRVITRTADGFDDERIIPVRFVPMTGEAQRR